MSDDWLDQLQKLHQADKLNHQAEEETKKRAEQAKQARLDKAIALLRQSRAHELLRQVQKALLNGQGTLDVFKAAGKYERAIILAWQGPISNARRPDPENPENYFYILVGVRKGSLWVNGKSVTGASPEALKAALLEAAKNPGVQKPKSEK